MAGLTADSPSVLEIMLEDAIESTPSPRPFES